MVKLDNQQIEEVKECERLFALVDELIRTYYNDVIVDMAILRFSQNHEARKAHKEMAKLLGKELVAI